MKLTAENLAALDELTAKYAGKSFVKVAINPETKTLHVVKNTIKNIGYDQFIDTVKVFFDESKPQMGFYVAADVRKEDKRSERVDLAIKRLAYYLTQYNDISVHEIAEFSPTGSDFLIVTSEVLAALEAKIAEWEKPIETIAE